MTNNNFVELICGTHGIKFMHNIENTSPPECPFCAHENTHKVKEEVYGEEEVYCIDCDEFFWIPMSRTEETPSCCVTGKPVEFTGQRR